MDTMQSSHRKGWEAPRWVRWVLNAVGWVVFCLALVLFSAVSTPRVAQADPPTPRPNCPWNHVWDGHECKEIQPTCTPPDHWDGARNKCDHPCPPNTIDIDGDNVDDGPPDCQPFRYINPPASCALTAPDGNGNVGCFLPQGGLGWGGRFVQASMGCLAIDRQPFPRALVNYPMQPGGDPGTKFGLNESVPLPGNDGMEPWIVPPAKLAELGMTAGRSGWYRSATDMAGQVPVGNLADAVRGPGLASDPNGAILPFSTRVILQDHGLWTGGRRTADIDNVMAVLVFVRDGDPEWSFPDNNLPFPDGSGQDVFFRFPRASFPTDINGYPVTNDGLDSHGNATLPAFRLVVQSVWDLWYWARWDNYTVVNNQAQPTGASVVRIQVGQYVSNRVWGVGNQEAVWQPAGGVTPICNQASYVPVPVVEAQAVLTR